MKVGITLSGGGSRAMAHVGFLQALKENGIEVGVVCGVSAGAVIAALVASGKEPLEIKEILERQNFKSYFRPSFQGGFFHIRKGVDELNDMLSGMNFDALPIPLRVGVTNMDTGKFEIKSSGDVALWSVVSCAIPPLVAPFNVSGVRYADGGIIDNLPVFALKGLADVLIGVNVNPIVPDAKNAIYRNVVRSIFLMLYANMQAGIEACDHYVEMTGVERFSIFKPSSFEACYQIGYDKGVEFCKELEHG